MAGGLAATAIHSFTHGVAAGSRRILTLVIITARVSADGSSMTAPPIPPRPPLFSLSTAARQAIRSTGWLTIGEVLVMGLSAVVSFVVARYLQPTRLGELQLVLSFAGLATPLVAMGTATIVMRELVRRPEARDGILASAFVLRLAAATVAIAATLSAAALWRDDLRFTALVAIASVAMLTHPFLVIECLFQSRVEAVPVVASRIGALIAGGAARLLAVASAGGVSVFVGLFTVQAAVQAWVLRLLLRRQASLSVRHASVRETRLLLKDSWPLLLSGIAVSIYMRVDQIMLAAYIDEAAVGFYAPAVLLAEMANILPMAISQSVIPGIVALREMDSQLYRRRMQQLYDIMTWIGIAVVAAFVLVSDPLIELTYGSAYAPSKPVLAILAVSVVFTFQGVTQSVWVLAENRQQARMIGHIAAAVANIALNAWWIPRHGLAGAAWATVVSYGLAVYLPILVMPSLRHGLPPLLWSWIAPLRWMAGRRGS